MNSDVWYTFLISDMLGFLFLNPVVFFPFSFFLFESSKAFDTLDVSFCLYFPSLRPYTVTSGYVEKEGSYMPLLVMERRLFLTFCFVYNNIQGAVLKYKHIFSLKEFTVLVSSISLFLKILSF